MDRLEAARCEKLALDIANEVTLSPALYDAFCKVSRSEFAPVGAHAFSLNPQPILANQWISSPLTVAKMTMALELEGVDKVLEIGCGSGYQAAILSKIVRRVFTIERISKLVNEAKKHFENLAISNVHVRYDDGNAGWKNYAPYERILLSAAAKSIDERLFSQLSDGGILVAPIEENGRQKIIKFYKKDNQIQKEILSECVFVPLLSGRE
ncbi:protein-L-isoaspartate(D-aspartate) O-methyltransferase [Campylobacter geochelonis]|uniref:Protein-L-isoaspartate O-methyltransferase n=1 Tax=Campylobacter geochelonis TaxID=1780362 RepID=A0A128ED35_9BACT|nr:protein-L-isoaspartate(D-aspartate) O-methyltransferase [Campylobacter geochelonis]QKF70434.1 L-isoaspartate protein carboxylmethyltransferase, type II [Campylobacter geochelonis]CZE46302.1 protein-L-isoaspartate O-methyltransferase [Campylobacter geochelonis]CZE46327.1 protein-L-isoaspartate O-methyltransferase [Campylobacter geochelonis]CZE50679.1 protein-L-isoaspartate O-methyltransferase [Campylobacter geochelonis]